MHTINSSAAVTYDPAKRDRTLAERGLDFAEAAGVFQGHHFTAQDARYDYGEPRFVTLGTLHGRMLVIVWTPRGEARRIISMRNANEREQRHYHHRLG